MCEEKYNIMYMQIEHISRTMGSK